MSGTWIVLGLLAAVAARGLGFAMDRSNAAAAAAATLRDVAPSLEVDQRGTVERVPNGELQVTGMDKILQSSDDKKSAGRAEGTSPVEASREKRSDDAVMVVRDANRERGNDDDDDDEKNVVLSFPFEEDSAAATIREAESTPRNVVLLLIDEAARDLETPWDYFRGKRSFPVQGLLRTCPNAELSATTVEKSDQLCECEHFLRTNVGALLSWARHARGMTTGAVSATNFSIPPALGYEGPPGGVRELEELDGNSVKPEANRSKPEARDAWHLIDLDEQSATGSASMTVAPTARRDATSHDSASDIFDVFSKIRIAFFRKLFDSIGGNLGGTEDEFSPRRPFPLRPSLVEMVGDTIDELESVSNDKGYVFVAAAPGNEIYPTVDLLQREISPSSTLLIVAGICSADGKPVPFYARGPGARALYEARNVWDLPGALRNAIGGSCHGIGCRKRRDDASVSLVDTSSQPNATTTKEVENGAVTTRRTSDDTTQQGWNRSQTETSSKNETISAKNASDDTMNRTSEDTTQQGSNRSQTEIVSKNETISAKNASDNIVMNRTSDDTMPQGSNRSQTEIVSKNETISAKNASDNIVMNRTSDDTTPQGSNRSQTETASKNETISAKNASDNIVMNRTSDDTMPQGSNRSQTETTPKNVTTSAKNESTIAEMEFKPKTATGAKLTGDVSAAVLGLVASIAATLVLNS